MTPFIIIPILIQLAVIGAIVYGVFLWRGRTVDTGPDVGIGTPRRFYFYSISFIALMMLVSGIIIVLMSLLDELFGEPVIRGATTRVATGLAPGPLSDCRYGSSIGYSCSAAWWRTRLSTGRFSGSCFFTSSWELPWGSWLTTATEYSSGR